MDYSGDEDALLAGFAINPTPFDVELQQEFDIFWDALRPAIDAMVRGESLPYPFPLSIYGSVYNFITSPSLGDDTFPYSSDRLANAENQMESRGARLYARLIFHHKGHMSWVISDAERRCKDKLELLQHLELAASKIISSWCRYRSPLNYLNRQWVPILKGHGFDICDTFHLPHLLCERFFIPEVSRRVIYATFVLTWTQPSLSSFFTPFIEGILKSQLRYQGMWAPERKNSKRGVYLASRPLEQVLSSSDISEYGEGVKLKEGAEWHRWRSFRSQSWPPFSQHWAIIIGNDLPAIKSTSHQADHHAHHRGLRSQPLILELTRNPDSIDFEEGNANELFENRELLGYTFCSDTEIRQLARDVLNSMRSDYDVISNNCQRFCKRLANCIVIPTTGKHILYKSNELPVGARDWILYRRFWDYFLVGEDGGACSVKPFPFSVHDLSLMAIDGLTASTLILNYNNAEKCRFFILAFTLWLCGWCGDIGVFRHWPRRNMTEDSWIKALERAADSRRLEYRALEEWGYRLEEIREQ